MHQHVYIYCVNDKLVAMISFQFILRLIDCSEWNVTGVSNKTKQNEGQIHFFFKCIILYQGNEINVTIETRI